MANDIDIRVGVTGGDDIVKVTKDLTKLDKNVKGLAVSFKEGKITSQAYFKGLTQQTSALKNMGVAYKDARSYVFGLAKETKDFTYEAEKSQKAFKRQQLAIQQAGYQVGDFAVQVASGTNWVTALTQQGTQLVSFFGGPWGAAIGAAGAIVGAFAVYLMKSSEAADTASKKIKTLADEIKNIDSTVQSWLNTKKAASLGLTVEEMFGETALEDAKRNLENLRKKVQELRSFWEKTDPTVAKFVVNSEDYQKALQELAQAEERVANLRLKAAEESLSKSKEILSSKQEELNLEVLAARYGEDSVAYREAAYKLERDIYLQKLAADGVFALEILKIKESMDKTHQLKSAQEDYNSVLSVAESVWDRIKTKITESAAKLKQQADAARQIQEMNFEFSAGGQALTKYGGRGTPTSQQTSLGKTHDIWGNVITKPTKKSGGASQFESQFEQLSNFLSTEKELLLKGYEDKQATLEEALSKGYILKEQYAEMEMELERKKNGELLNLENKLQANKVSTIAGGIQNILTAAANGNEKMLKMARVVGAAEALINTYRGAAQTLADKELPFWAKFGAAASIISTGLGFVSAIKSGSSSSSAPSGSEATMSSAATATPQRVIIEGIDRNSLISGEQLSGIFDALYKENKDRGFVFEVAR